MSKIPLELTYIYTLTRVYNIALDNN